MCVHNMQGRTETCRYLVLLGLDPRLRDDTGANAFQHAENHPSVAKDALVLAEDFRRIVKGTGGHGRAPRIGSGTERGETADILEKKRRFSAGKWDPICRFGYIFPTKLKTYVIMY